MTDEEARRFKFPAWLPFAFSVAVVAMGAFASWYDLRGDVALQQVKCGLAEDRIASLEARHVEDTSVAVRLQRLEDAVALIGGALKIPGFPSLNGGGH